MDTRAPKRILELAYPQSTTRRATLLVRKRSENLTRTAPSLSNPQCISEDINDDFVRPNAMRRIPERTCEKFGLHDPVI